MSAIVGFCFPRLSKIDASLLAINCCRSSTSEKLTSVISLLLSRLVLSVFTIYRQMSIRLAKRSLVASDVACRWTLTLPVDPCSCLRI